MEAKFSKEDLAEFRGLFEALDSRRDGVITSDELGDAMRALGQRPTEAELKEMIDKADLDGNGKIDFEEFAAMMSRQNKHISKEDELKDVFRMVDRDGNGQISADELRQVMTNLGEKVTVEEVHDMIRELDMDGNGEIDMEEFVKIMLTN